MNNSVLDYIYGGVPTTPLDETPAEIENDVLDFIYGSPKKSTSRKVVRDSYGNTEKEVLRERAKIAKDLGQILPEEATRGVIPDGTISLSEREAKGPQIAPEHQVEVSNEYASRHRAERLNKTNLLDTNRKGEVSTTQYKNANPGVDRSSATSLFARVADTIDDKFDDVTDYIFGKTHYKNKKEEEAAARADMNKQVNEDGNIIYSRNATMNDESITDLRSELLNAEEEPDADQLVYYARIDNPDGTSSYKIGVAGVDTFSRTSEEDRGKDITYLWTKRTNDASKYEKLFHGNRDMLRTRRNDIGTDAENYGAGKSEIYNADFLQMDGTVSGDKVRTLNMSSQAKLAELGVNVEGRYDSRGMESAYKELDKTEKLYGRNSTEYQDVSQLVSNMEQKGKRDRALASVPGDLLGAVASSTQQVLGSVGDLVLDAVTPGNNDWLDGFKSAEQADKAWGYRGRKEVEALGRGALRSWKQGDYVGALVKGIQASPDTVAQSLPDMALMFAGGAGVAVKGATLGAKTAAYMNPMVNKGLAVFAAKQTNNQIDERLANGEDNTNVAKIGAMFASNYVLGGLDRLSFGKTVSFSGMREMMKSIPEAGMVGIAKKAGLVANKLVKAGSTEAVQEFVQSYGEAINAGLGTERYGDNAFQDHFLDEATTGALLGFGAGGLTKGVSTGAEKLVGKIKIPDKILKKATDVIQGKEVETSDTSSQGATQAYEDLVTKHEGTATTTAEELNDLADIQEQVVAANDPELMSTLIKRTNKLIAKLQTEEVDLGDTKLGSRATVAILKSMQDVKLDPNNPTVKKNIEHLAKAMNIDASVLASTVALTTEDISRTEEEIGLDINKFYTTFLEDTMIDPKGEGVASVKKEVTRFLGTQGKKLAVFRKHAELARQHFVEGKEGPYRIPLSEHKTLSGQEWSVDSIGGVRALEGMVRTVGKTVARLETLNTFMNSVQGVESTSTVEPKVEVTPAKEVVVPETQPSMEYNGLTIVRHSAGGFDVLDNGVKVTGSNRGGTDVAKQLADRYLAKKAKEAPKGKETSAGTVTMPSGEKIPVVSVEGLTGSNGEPLLARHVRKKDGTSDKVEINADKALWKSKFEDKAWTKPKKQKDGTAAKPIVASAFKNVREFGKFVLQHEAAHNTLGRRKSGETDGQYETRVNEEAAKVLKIDLYAKPKVDVKVEPKVEEVVPVRDKVIPEEVVEASKDVISSGQIILDNSYITKASNKVKGKGKLVADIVTVVKEAGNKLQNTSLKDIINSAKGDNKSILKTILNKSAAFVSDTYSTSKLNSLSTADKSPMMQLLFSISPSTGKIIQNRLVPFVMQVNAINGFADNVDLLKKYKTKEDVARLLGLADRSKVSSAAYGIFMNKGIFMRDLADSIGRKVLKDLGYKQVKGTTPEEYGRIASEIGTATIMMMQKDGLVEIHEVSTKEVNDAIGNSDKVSNVSANVKLVSAVATGKNLYEVATKQRELLTAIEEETDIELANEANVPKTEPLKKENELKIHRSDTNAEGPSTMLKVKNKLQQEEWTIDDSANEVLSGMDKEVKLKYMGYVSTSSDEYKNSSYDRKIEIDGQNENVESSLDALDPDSTIDKGYNLSDYYKGAKDKASMYFEYFVSKNFRYFIKSSGLNPQTDKLHRFIVHNVKAAYKYSKRNKKDMFSFKYAVAQGFGFKVDGAGVTRSDIASEFKRLLDIGYKELKAEFDRGDANIHAGGLGHYINAMEALKTYEESKGNTFESNALAEVDHKTNGFAHKLMQFPLLPKDLMLESLNQVGVWTELINEDTTALGGLDAYQTNASGFTKDLVALATLDRNSIVPKGVRTFIQKLDESNLLAFVTDGKVTSELRNIMKPLFMVFNYSAGIKSIKKTLVHTLSSKMLNTIVTKPNEEGNKAFLSMLNQARVDIGTSIEHQIRTSSPDKIKLNVEGQKMSLAKFLSDSYNAVYGEKLEESFARYDNIKDINSIVNAAFKGMFAVFMARFTEEVLEKNLTLEEIDVWLTDNKKLIPHVVTSHGDGTPLHIVDTLKAAVVEYSTTTEFKTAIKVTKEGSLQNSIQSNPVVKAFKAAVSSGSVLPIHSIDGDNMTRTLDAHPEALGVHDADVVGAKNLTAVAKSANEHFYNIHKEYSIMEEVMDAFNLIHEEAGSDLSVEVGLKAAELFGVEGKSITLSQIATTLELANKEVAKKRAELLSQDLTIENMIFNNDAAYKVPAQSETELGSKISDLTEDQQAELADELFILDQKEVNKVVSGEVDITDIMPSILGGFGSIRKRYTVLKATVNDAFAITVYIQDRDTGARYTYGFGEHSTVSAGKARKFRIDRPLLTDEIRDRQYIAEETGRIASSDSTANMDAHDKLFDDLSTNTEAILDMVDTLNKQTGNATDKTTIDNLKEVLSMFDTEFLNATAVYFKELASDEESSGSFDYKKNEVNLFLSQKKNRQYDHMELPVIYTHEMLHALTYFAMRSNDVKAKALVRRLNYVYEAAEKVVTVEDFINDSNPNKADARLKAERDLSYVFGNNKEQGLAEFIAYGLTLPKLVTKLKSKRLRENKENKGMWQTLINLVKGLIGLVLGGTKLKDYSVSMFENLQNLSVALGTINNHKINKIEKEPSGVKLFLDFTNDQLVSLIKLVKKGTKKDTDYLPTISEDAGRVERIMYLAKLFPTLLMENKHRGTLVMMLDFMYAKPTGMLQNIIRNILTPEDNDLERQVEKLKLLSDEVDKIKKDLSESVAKGISTAFDESSYLSKQDDSDLLDIVVDLDLPSLLEEFSIEEVAKILKDGNYRRTLINKYEAKIKAEARESRWVVNQSRVLGYFMAHGVIDEGYNLNAHNIIAGRLLTTNARAVAKPSLEATVDKLATLYGIEYSDKETVERAAELATNTKGMTTLMSTLTTIKEQSLKLNFDNDKTKMIKGYAVEVSPSTLDVMVRPMSELKKLRHEGYELKFEMPENDVTSTEPMGVFVMEDNTTSKYTRGATLLGNEVAKGSKLANILGATDSFTSSGFALAKAKARKRLAESTKQAVEEDIDPEELFKNRIGNSLTPVFDNSGKIKDFRYLMSKQNKKEILQLNRRASKVVGITFAGVSNKVNRADSNKNIMDLIAKDMKKNYEGDSVGKNLYPYVEVGKDANNKEGKAIYEVLPFAFREFINKYPKKKIAVRADMLHEYFGYKNIDILNTEVAKNIPRPILKKLKLANKVWEGIVDIYSTDITIRTPDVVISNTTSNVAYLAQLGYNPKDVIKDFQEFTPIVYAHVAAHKDLLELNIKVQIGTITKAEQRKITRIKALIASNPVIEEIMEEGLLGNIVEEVIAAGDDDGSGNIVKEFIREKVDKLPEVVQVGLDNMYVTKNTDAYKNIERAVQMGDFIARVVLNNNLKKEGVPKKERMIRLRDAFVNYSKLYAPLEEYGNRMGAFKFTKYAKGSQRSFGVLANEKPLYALMSLVAQELLFEIDDVLDQNVLTRSYRSMKFNPMDILTTVATPDALRPF